MVSKKRDEGTESERKNGVESGYEQSREERIKANLERMEKLGILDLSRKLKSHKKPHRKNPCHKKPALPSSASPRRSSRLKTMTPVSYVEKRVPKEKSLKDIEIRIEEGSKPEIYTEEDEKLLGHCKTTWTLFVDGYAEPGQRIYDPYEGKSCHQCRQKTLGHRTDCSSCKGIQGKLCGDCLYMRYGENVIEANENPNWTCPVCRGICNCSRCRRLKGWNPTGSIYRKVVNLGFKSVAHYLIQTRRLGIKQEEADTSLLLADSGADFSGDNLMPQSDDSIYEEEMEADTEDDSDGAYSGNDGYPDNDYDITDKDELNEEDDER